MYFLYLQYRDLHAMVSCPSQRRSPVKRILTNLFCLEVPGSQQWTGARCRDLWEDARWGLKEWTHHTPEENLRGVSYGIRVERCQQGRRLHYRWFAVVRRINLKPRMVCTGVPTWHSSLWTCGRLDAKLCKRKQSQTWDRFSSALDPAAFAVPVVLLPPDGLHHQE